MNDNVLKKYYAKRANEYEEMYHRKLDIRQEEINIDKLKDLNGI